MDCVAGKASSDWVPEMNHICGDWWVEENWEISIQKEPSKESVIDCKYGHTALEAPTKKWSLLPHPMNIGWLYNLFSWAENIRNGTVQVSSLGLADLLSGQEHFHLHANKPEPATWRIRDILKEDSSGSSSPRWGPRHLKGPTAIGKPHPDQKNILLSPV